MLAEGTVFILGAAVSNEFGMPLGGKLRELIANVLDRNVKGCDYLHQAIYYGVNAGPTSDAVRHVASGVLAARSIDNLADHLRDNPAAARVVKLTIARTILQQEQSSSLFVQGREFGLRGASFDTTLGNIFQLIVGNVAVADLEEAFSRVSFITFNYDRTLEWFLANALIAYSGLSAQEAMTLVGKVNIVHAYGVLGELADLWFGNNLAPNNISRAAERIKTFSEELVLENKVRISTVVGEAERLIILGCFPHPQNLELLRPPHYTADDVFMTAYLPAPTDPLG